MTPVVKNLVFAVLLVGLVYVGYKLFFGGDSAQLMIDPGVSEGQLVASEFLIKLNELQAIDFTSDLFVDDKFNSLESFSTEPEPTISGRGNPFSF